MDTVSRMATLIYDGREYPIADEDVHAFKQAAAESAVTGAQWLSLDTPEGVVAFFVTLGVSITVVP